VDAYDQLFGRPGDIARRIAVDVTGPAAIPRRNGEPIFNEPWESRIFGAAVVLCDREFFQWDEFRQRLIEKIASADQCGEPSSYYECFLSAFERLLIDKGLCVEKEVEEHVEITKREEDHRR